VTFVCFVFVFGCGIVLEANAKDCPVDSLDAGTYLYFVIVSVSISIMFYNHLSFSFHFPFPLPFHSY
jgi:hypothetical protein